MTRKRCLWSQAGHNCPMPAIAVVGLRVPPHEPGAWHPRCARHLIDRPGGYSPDEELVIHWYGPDDHPDNYPPIPTQREEQPA